MPLNVENSDPKLKIHTKHTCIRRQFELHLTKVNRPKVEFEHKEFEKYTIHTKLVFM